MWESERATTLDVFIFYIPFLYIEHSTCLQGICTFFFFRDATGSRDWFVHPFTVLFIAAEAGELQNIVDGIKHSLTTSIIRLGLH